MAATTPSAPPADAFICPITQAVMRDPVTDLDGNTFERAAIVQWLQQHGTSPITRHAMSADDLVPNRALCQAIAEAAGGVEPTPQSTHATAPPAPPTDSDDVLGLQCVVDPLTSEMLISIIPPEGPRGSLSRLPVDVCCVIDISGSMGGEASVKDAKGNAECHGLTLLDVVKHATRTVANLLGPDDRLALVTFTNNAAVVLPLTRMDPAGKKKLGELADTVQPLNMTNLWDGLHTGMELLRGRPPADENRTAAVLLLTDGQPNIIPPRGHDPTLDRYLDQFDGSVPFTVNTFGFGYSLDSALLNTIAEKTGGMYVFIPDSGLVGTVFVNTMANILATAATSVSLSIECGRPIVDADCTLTTTSTGAHGRLGTVQFGQQRNVAFRLGAADSKSAAEPPLVKLSYKYCGATLEKLVSATVAGTSAAEARCIQMHVARRIFVNKVLEIHEGCLGVHEACRGSNDRANRQLLDAAACLADACPLGATIPLVVALQKDLVGEVSLAVQANEGFVKWGKHFLPSLIRATRLQQCNNFKDHSVQLYGGALFKKLQDAGEAVFTKLPPPKPSATARPTSSGGSGGRGGCGAVGRGGAPRVAAPVNMQSYYNCSGGCVLSECLVSLAHGGVVAACQVRPGDRLHTSGGGAAVVRLVVRIAIPRGGIPLMVFPGGLSITEFHPVKIDGAWTFPVDAAGARRVLHVAPAAVGAGAFVYTYVLDDGVSAVINGIEVVALAHGLRGDVVEHEYLGTKRVLEDLALLPGFDSGCVTVGSFERDPATLRISGLSIAAPLPVPCSVSALAAL